ncbi:hypothetical protein [Nonomuraea sp. NPDC003754]
MLANLVPGIRDLRAPLAAGYLWLVVAWLTWARHLPTPDKATDLLADAYRLGSTAGLPAVGVALSFAAYIIGLFSTSVSTPALKLLSRRFDSMEFVLEEITDRFGVDGQRHLFPTALTYVLREELRLIPARLLGREPEIFEAHDRLNAEAEFRAAVSLPLTAIGVTMAFLVNPSVMFASSLLAFTAMSSAVSRKNAADRVLIEAIRADRFEYPTLKDVTDIAHRLVRVFIESEQRQGFNKPYKKEKLFNFLGARARYQAYEQDGPNEGEAPSRATQPKF